ncbi:diguanylate cyclase (GGDEF)-like protein [Hydrogenivirga caldilitoris]|uniref:diguanylate cyclase n=1 Tax=Hydrogenivirga caldilitoris TaxID=246264 RepID=A0A497XWP9_9AQUI|nr:GGDEF domain-containing protein [Hydrogenivirga caldilitoris]RLJ71193.1 diguanylate cyclase (GGDEF)-like protein [Hydrogenivirga caldilitoris]
MVLACIGVTFVASYIHHRVILGIPQTELSQYVVPFFVGSLFGLLISHLIRLHRALKQKEKELKELALRDPLTGLPNRRILMDFLGFEINRANRKGTPLSIAFVDIDDFKQINDTYGHLVGDRVLKALSGILKKNLRSTDLVGRYGGEEFLIIMPETDLKTAVKVMERLRKRIEETHFEPVGRVSVSIGITELRAGDDMNSVLGRADEKLYQAKREGKNRVLAG